MIYLPLWTHFRIEWLQGSFKRPNVQNTPSNSQNSNSRTFSPGPFSLCHQSVPILYHLFWEQVRMQWHIQGWRRSLPDCTVLGSRSTQQSVVLAAAPPTDSWPRGWGHQNRTCLQMLSNHWWYCRETHSSETTTGNLILKSNCSALGDLPQICPVICCVATEIYY